MEQELNLRIDYKQYKQGQTFFDYKDSSNLSLGDRIWDLGFSLDRNKNKQS